MSLKRRVLNHFSSLFDKRQARRVKTFSNQERTRNAMREVSKWLCIAVGVLLKRESNIRLGMVNNILMQQQKIFKCANQYVIVVLLFVYSIAFDCKD